MLQIATLPSETARLNFHLHSASLTIVTAEKKIVAENLTNKDAAQLLHLFLAQNMEHKEPAP